MFTAKAVRIVSYKKDENGEFKEISNIYELEMKKVKSGWSTSLLSVIIFAMEEKFFGRRVELEFVDLIEVLEDKEYRFIFLNGRCVISKGVTVEEAYSKLYNAPKSFLLVNDSQKSNTFIEVED
jgi:hypothetical protein